MTSLKPQRGMALIVSLVLLLILTVLAISMASTSTLQQRISGNAQQQNLAFQASESGLKYWANWFDDHGSKPTEPATVTLDSGASGTATARVTSSSLECERFIPAQSLGGGRIFNCYQVSSQAKACKSLSGCDPTTSTGQARALHRRSYIQATY